jgi:uncharacterized membrane protein YccC
VAFGAWLVIVNNNFREHDNYDFIFVTVLSLLIVAGRIFLKWPVSGHGLLGALIAVLGCWFWLRFFAIAILLQAFITKWVGGENPMSVIYGALAGIAIAELITLKSYFAEKRDLKQRKKKR